MVTLPSTLFYIMYNLLLVMGYRTRRSTFSADIAYHLQIRTSIVLLQSKHADTVLKCGLFGQSPLKIGHVHAQVKNLEENAWPLEPVKMSLLPRM